ncbi:MAG TPA: hypothetical protein VGK54_10500 [Chloroflexota bacterium]|jgi:hypothetical protein
MTLLMLSAAGWALVAYVVLALPVTPTAQIIFYGGAFGALAGTWAMVARLAYRRRLQRDLGLIAALSGGLRFALALEFGLWLQSLRMLTVPYAVLLLAAYLTTEYLFRSLAPRNSQ